MNTLNHLSTAPELGVRASHTAPVVVATDGQVQSDAAFVIGHMLAGSTDALRIVTVMKGLPAVPDGQLALSADADAARRAEARRKAAEQIARSGGRGLDIELREGDPARAIARLAHESGATMIVAGLGRHRVADRIFGDETALRLIRLSDVPVYAVATGTSRAPRRVVVAIDFSETGLRAARMSLDVAAAGATIYLTHVAPRDSSLADWHGGPPSYKHDVERGLQRTREQLHIPRDIVVQKVVLQGDPATELLAFAASVNADLIATGSHGHGFVARLLVGSVTTRIVRCSTCSVLTVPHAAAMTDARITVEPAAIVTPTHSEWEKALDDFSKRNIGRVSTLEIDDRDIGAQPQESDCPFLGVTYDRYDRKVDVMFGERGQGRRQLTHEIGEVAQIDIWRDESGQDLGLRIVHGSGQTILTFS
jgi:nucleotide-binding universal stress UspA family protein